MTIPTPENPPRPPAGLDSFLDELLVGSGFSTDGFGLDSILICDEDGTRIEQDAPKCPDCGRANPLRAMGLL